MIEGKTSTGFEFKIDENVGDDWEIVELYAEASHGDELASINVLKKILGQDQYNALKDHCRAKNGRVSTEAMGKEMDEIRDTINKNKETKN